VIVHRVAESVGDVADVSHLKQRPVGPYKRE
jgi:hypothetical protein